MTKKVLALLLAVALMAAMVPLSVGAAETPDGFVIEDGVLVEYTGTATEVVIPSGVTSIGESFWVDGHHQRNHSGKRDQY